MLNRLLVAALVCLIATSAAAQDLLITKDILLRHTPIRDQGNSGTCWAFCVVSLLESEVMRKGGDSIHLAELYTVSKAYEEKTGMFLRMHGRMKMEQGGEPSDVINLTKRYGIIPQTSFALANPNARIDHYTLEKMWQEANKEILDKAEASQSINEAEWRKQIAQLTEKHIGKATTKVAYKGKSFSPKEFTTDVLHLDMDDYVCLTSFTHHPFYKPYTLELPDNWMFARALNIPLDELNEVADTALAKGYSMAWGGDTSEPFFLAHDAIAFLSPLTQTDNTKPQSSRPGYPEFTNNRAVEPAISQETRQKHFDNFETTDDHGMHIVGKAHDSYGRTYYIAKNSWGASTFPRSKFTGYVYISQPYFRLKTVTIVLHKDAIPQHIRQKLGI